MAPDLVTLCMAAGHIDESSSQDEDVSSGTLLAELAELAEDLKTACQEMRVALPGILRSKAMPYYIGLWRALMGLLTFPIIYYCFLVAFTSRPELLLSPIWCIAPFTLGLVVLRAYEPATGWHDLPLHVRRNRWHLRHFRCDWRIPESAIALFSFGIAILLVHAVAALSEERYDGLREQLSIPHAHIRLQNSSRRVKERTGEPFHIRLALSLLILSYLIASAFVKLARPSGLPRSPDFIIHYYRQILATIAA